MTELTPEQEYAYRAARVQRNDTAPVDSAQLSAMVGAAITFADRQIGQQLEAGSINAQQAEIARARVQSYAVNDLNHAAEVLSQPDNSISPQIPDYLRAANPSYSGPKPSVVVPTR